MSLVQFQSVEQELRVRLAARKLQYQHFRLLADWLGCYQYVLPADRKLHDWLSNRSFTSASQIFRHYLWCSYVESTLTFQEQLCLTSIHESET